MVVEISRCANSHIRFSTHYQKSNHKWEDCNSPKVLVLCIHDNGIKYKRVFATYLWVRLAKIMLQYKSL